MAKVYISSTYSDLKDFRASVYQVLTKLGHDVKAMEDYVATDQRPLDKCLADVKECDLYVGIFAWRYGYVPDDDNPERRSITELELRQAKDSGVECLVFLHDESGLWPPADMDEDLNRIKSLRQYLGRDFTLGFFTNPENLATNVSLAVSSWERRTSRDKSAHSTVQSHFAIIHVMDQRVDLPHWSEALPVRFSITNLTDDPLKLTKLVLMIVERKETSRIALKKPGAPVSESGLTVRIDDTDELDLLSEVNQQFILNAGTSDAFKLALFGPEGHDFTVRLRASVERLATRDIQQIESTSFEVRYPIRSPETLKRRRGNT